MAALEPRADDIVATVLLLVTVVVLSRAAQRAVEALLRQYRSHLGLDLDRIGVARRWTAGLVWTLGLLVVLPIWGVEIAGLWTTILGVLSVAGVALIATWAIASNLTAGSLISFTRPFHLGETIEVLPEAVGGRVVDRNLFFTVVVEESGKLAHIPNNLLFQRVVRCGAERGRPRYDALLQELDGQEVISEKRIGQG